jgi:hypothetical protein
MSRLFLGVVALVVIAAACGDETSGGASDDDGTSSNTGAGDTGAGNTTGGNGGGSAGGNASGGNSSGGGNVAATPICLPPCNTAADCDLGSPAFDADNYSCNGGHCVYLGCNNDTECAAQNMVCRADDNPLLGNGTFCVFPCNTAADCDLGGGPAFDANNYACENGGCQYSGCNDDTECAALGNYVCRDLGGLSFCVTPCQAPADCDIGSGAAYDADNYSCPQDYCVYEGCNSTSECMSVGNLVCAEP